jgi:ankyrin repeat protein
MNKPKNLITLSAIAFTLLLSSTLFANSEDELGAAINKNDIVTVERLLKEGASPQKIESFSILPSLAVSNLLLNNKEKSLDPDIFLSAVLKVPAVVGAELINQQYELVKLALEKHADPQKIESFSTLPSIELSRLLLHNKKKPLSLSRFFNLVLVLSCQEYNHEKNAYEISTELTRQQYELVELVLSERDASVQKISYFSIPPSLEISELLLKKGLTPAELFELALFCEYANTHPEFVQKQQELIEFALLKGVDPNQMKHPEMEYAFRYKELFVSRDQGWLLKQLGKALSKTSVANSETEDNDSTTQLAEKLNQSDGHCFGLTTLWLYSKWLQFTYPEKNYGYNHDWFKNTTRIAATWDGKENLSDKATTDFQKFGSLVDFFQSSSDYIKGMPSMEIESPLILSMLDTGGKTLKKKYTIASKLTAKQLSDLLKEIVHDNEWVYVMHPEHATGLFKHTEHDQAFYYFYDPNDPKGEYKDTSIEKIAEAITNINRELSQRSLEVDSSLGLIVVGDPEVKSYTYPTQKEFLTKIRPTFDEEALMVGLYSAIRRDCLESFKFFLEQKELNLNKNKLGFGMIFWAMRVQGGNLGYMVTELLRRTDPNTPFKDPYPDPDSSPSAIIGKTILQIASQYEAYIDVVEIFLNDARTNINLANKNDGKTALMYAAENGQPKTIELLINKKADLNLKDKQGRTALMLAVLAVQKNITNEGLLEKYSKVIEQLCSRGANLDEKDNDGKTALDLAVDEKGNIVPPMLIVVKTLTLS